MKEGENAGQPKKRGPGRKPKLTPELVNQAQELAKEGAIDKEIAAGLGIAPETLCRYKDQYPQFYQAIKNGREFANQCVVGALFKSANGYDTPVSKRRWEYHQDPAFPKDPTKRIKVLVEESEEIKHINPNATAQALWLNNKMAEEFARRPEDAAGKLAAINFQMIIVNPDGSESVMPWPPQAAQTQQAKSSALTKQKS